MSGQKTKDSTGNPLGSEYISSERLLLDFTNRGLVILSPESLGLPTGIHHQIYQKQKQAIREGKRIRPSTIPQILDIINSPGLVKACDQLVGENWAIVPFSSSSITSGGSDQHWHKDDNAPRNSRKQRHHQAIQIEMLYYPQMVTDDMGPTATIPYSQYWTFNHEENHDNFAGADHLDFNYHLKGMESQTVSGPNSTYDPDDIVNRLTDHDLRMRQAVTDLQWPLVEPFEVAPLSAGSVILYSHNMFHRGNHRRDDWRTWQDNPRFMWRFWIYRTTDPSQPDTRDLLNSKIDWNNLGEDPLTNIDLTSVGSDITTVWRYHYHWTKTGKGPPQVLSQDQKEAEKLGHQLRLKNDSAEPDRIGAAYRLANTVNSNLAVNILEDALYDTRENVRRAATYGLIAVGNQATETLIKAANSPLKWVRKAGVYALGDACELSEKVLETVSGRLKYDPSVYVRSVAAGSLGCLGRRSAATGIGNQLIPSCLKVLVDSLNKEENRLAMDLSQGRSIKFVRPTDESDVCEGGGFDLGLDRFQPVRSSVRENVLWSMVILCSKGSSILGSSLDITIEALKEVIQKDQNIISVGYAMDALSRLASIEGEEPIGSKSFMRLRNELFAILTDSPVQSLDTLSRSGLSLESLSRFTEPI